MRMTPVVLTTLLLTGVGCGESTRDPGEFDRPDGSVTVDNCSIEAPCALTSGVSSAPGDFIAPATDVDRYTITVAEGQIIDVNVRMAAARSQVQLRGVLFDPSLDQAAQGQSNSGPSQTQMFSFQHVADQAGVWSLDVRDVGGDDADTIRSYLVTITLIEQTDNNEPNDGPLEATPLTEGVTATGQIASQDDEDWFTIDAPAGKIMQIRATLPGTLSNEWELYSEDDSTQPIASSSTGRPESNANQNRPTGAGGTFLLRVFDRESKSSTESAYQLTVTLIDEPDAFELPLANDSRNRSTPLTLGQPVEGILASTSDLDFYTFEVVGARPGNAKVFSITLERLGEAETPVELQFAVLDSEGELFCPTFDDGCLALRRFNDGSLVDVRCHDNRICRHGVPLTEEGTFYVRVNDFEDNEFDESMRYRLTVDEVSLPADDTENFNESAALPVPLVTSTAAAVLEFDWVEGYISYTGDVDVYTMQFPISDFAPTQNGDWEWSYDFFVDGPSEVEYRAEIVTPNESGGVARNVVPQCRQQPPSPAVPDPCDTSAAQNFHDLERGALSPSCQGNDDRSCCQVVFRVNSDRRGGVWRLEVRDDSTTLREFDNDTPAGDDFDVRPQAKYRFRLRARAGCQVPGPCAGEFIEPGVGDRCGRP